MRHFLILTLLSCALLSGCGFEPMYQSAGQYDSGVAQDFKNVSIPAIPNREGQILRNELIDRLHGGSEVINARYRLQISRIGEARRNFDITETSDTTRTQLRLTSEMRLIDTESNKIALTRRLESFASYNILESQFTTRVSRDYARENALRDMAGQIERQLALYLRQ